jgi:hypothetical protein
MHMDRKGTMSCQYKNDDKTKKGYHNTMAAIMMHAKKSYVSIGDERSKNQKKL